MIVFGYPSTLAFGGFTGERRLINWHKYREKWVVIKRERDLNQQRYRVIERGREVGAFNQLAGRGGREERGVEQTERSDYLINNQKQGERRGCLFNNQRKRERMRSNKALFVLEPDKIARLKAETGLSDPDLLCALVHDTQSQARPPISNYPVAAVALGSSGRIFAGVNLEFPGLPLHHSVHSEQFLLANAAHNNEPSVKLIAISSAPCGHCRQFFQELRDASSVEIIIAAAGEDCNPQPLSYFLPHRFGPDDLLSSDVPLLLDCHNNRLQFLDKPDHEEENEELRFSKEITHRETVANNDDLCHNGLCNGNINDVEEFDNLKKAALKAANGAHAPYSRCPSGVALMTADGGVYAGGYIESAAYNPSLGPLQAALVAFVAAGRGGYGELVRAALVEKSGAVISQESTVRLLLESIAPHCEFHTFRCCVMSD
ncbi:cytidine deaminase 1 isoform X1 [Amborella trichopoda]|uniref:cytidine deaminase n=2 Tax=Amborella trichopoda TaxID=13333 RepID=U5CT65_AMBTC|nr:cytidine deaminase 1 isoform X1 [Amborella trichopoda]ERN16451.1 hypothetical protein AMTR_s00052p00198020 [Amborella trichopoda]|eukprot:XP_006854984.3 cytidine deaminase 1 isoform X1 [Amborella trichopoda]